MAGKICAMSNRRISGTRRDAGLRSKFRTVHGYIVERAKIIFFDSYSFLLGWHVPSLSLVQDPFGRGFFAHRKRSTFNDPGCNK